MKSNCRAENGDMSAWFLCLFGSRLANSAGVKVRDFWYTTEIWTCVSEALVAKGWNEDIKQSGP